MTHCPNSTPAKMKPPPEQNAMHVSTVMLELTVAEAARVRAVETSVKHPAKDQFPGSEVGLLWRIINSGWEGVAPTVL